MSNKESEKLKSFKSKISNIVQSNITRALIFFAIVLCMVFCMASMLKYTQFKNELQRLQSEVSSIQEGVVTVREETQTEQTISYLETEMTRHREFIESQENRLVWLVGIIGSFAVVLLAYVGLENRRAIKQTVREQYGDAVSEVVGEMIGSKENEQYLKQAVMAERKAKTTGVLFLYFNNKRLEGSDSRKRLMTAEDELLEAGFKVRHKKYHLNSDQSDFEDLMKKDEIIVFEVNPQDPNNGKSFPKTGADGMAQLSVPEKTTNYSDDSKSESDINSSNSVQINKPDIDVSGKTNESSMKNSPDTQDPHQRLRNLFAVVCDQENKMGIMYYENSLPDFNTMKNKKNISIVNMCSTLKQIIYTLLYH